MVKRIGKFTQGVDGAKIYYEVADFGKKDKCLVFVHGLGGNVSIWQKELAYFKSEGIPTIAIDLRGHGRSARSDKAGFYKFENFVNDVIKVLEAERFPDYCLIGHSLGGMIAADILAEHKTNTTVLVLVDADYKIPPPFSKFRNSSLIMAFLKFFAEKAPNLKADAQVNFRDFEGTGNYSLDRVTSDILHVSLRDYLHLAEDILGFNTVVLLNKISVPTLIIQGTSDLVVPPEVALELKDRIKHSELDIIEGANHFLIVNNPLDVSREIERFLIKRKFL